MPDKTTLVAKGLADESEIFAWHDVIPLLVGGGDCFSRWRSLLRTQAVAMANRVSSWGTKDLSFCWSDASHAAQNDKLGRLLQSLAILAPHASSRNGKPSVILRNEGSVLLLNRCFACGSAWQAGEIASVAGAPSQWRIECHDESSAMANDKKAPETLRGW